MSKKLILFLFFPLSIFAQQDSITFKYWVEFTDKNNSNYNLNIPEGFLSQRAIERRVNQKIDIKNRNIFYKIVISFF